MNTRTLSRSAILWVALAASAAPADAAPSKITPPRRLDAVEVPYPVGANGDATVVLSVVVDARGEVTDVSVRDGAPPFAGAAVAAVRSWRFSPATRDDVAVSARITATMAF